MLARRSVESVCLALALAAGCADDGGGGADGGGRDAGPGDGSPADAGPDAGPRDAGPDGALLSCMEADLAMGEAFDAAWSDPNACATALDCAFHSRDVDCPGGATLRFCEVAAHGDSAGALQAAVDEAAAAVCPRVPPDCVSGPSCAPTGIACVDGACAPRFDCAIAGSRDCAELAATSVDLTEARCERCQGAPCGSDAECDGFFPCVEGAIRIVGCCEDEDCGGIAMYCGQYTGVNDVCVPDDDV